jgi:ABC-type transport system involved in multi-copper enzyme maturation permease subunit
MMRPTKPQTLSSIRNDFLQQPWGLYWIQFLRLTRIEVRRNLFSWRASWIYFLAFIPTFILLIHVATIRFFEPSMSEDTLILAGIIQLYYIRLAVFFGCLGIFSRLIRGEMIERSLHFYLLSPVRREVLLMAKFAAGSISALLLFGIAVLADFALMYSAYGAAGQEYVLHGPGLGHLGAYLTIISLACLGYGAVFLLLSMMFRNPTPAAMLVFGWETINPILPSLLQKLSVASYLRHLMPVNVAANGFFALLTVQTEPVSGWAATLGLLLLIALVLLYSCYRIRTLEIRYTTE